MIALIDGDILCYRVAFTTQNEDTWIARARLRELIDRILRTTGCEDYEIWLSDSTNNYRKQLFPRYKANRTQPKPIHLDYLANLIVDKWGAEISWGQEADDALGIRATELERIYRRDHPEIRTLETDPTIWRSGIICSIDKDLKQIPGHHYNFVKEEFDYVTEWRGLYTFYLQCLTGDSTDNIRVNEGLSCRGIGSDKGQRILEGCITEACLFTGVLGAYEQAWDGIGPESPADRLLLTARLLKIRREHNSLWNFPTV